MHHFLPSNLAETLHDISSERLSSYRTFFLPQTDEELYGIYCWNDAISSRLMRLIGIIEIILRNRIHRELSQFAYQPSLSLGTSTSNDWYRFVIGNTTKAGGLIKKEIGKITRQSTVSSLISPVPANRIVAAMSYGFWPRAFQISHTAQNLPIPWDVLIPAIFPRHHQQAQIFWADAHQQGQLFKRLELIGDIRNRIAHFEPVWKFKELKSEWIHTAAHPVRTVAPAPLNSDEAIERMKLTYRKISQVLNWLSKERAGDYMESENHHCLDWLLTKEALEEYKNIGSERTYRLSSLSKSWGLKLKLRQRKSFLIVDKSVPIGLFYRLHRNP